MCNISPIHMENIDNTRFYASQCSPWPHFVVDNFVDQEQFRIAQREIMTTSHSFSVLTGDDNKVQYSLLKYLPLAKLFYSMEFRSFLSALSLQDLFLNESNKVQLRKADHRTPYFPRHVDKPPFGRSLVVIFYLSPSWQPEYRGRLLLHKNKHSRHKGTICIEPIENRLVAFFSDDTNWHSVEKVNGWERYSVLSEWICESA